MSNSAAKRSKRKSSPGRREVESDLDVRLWRRLTQAAFGLSLVLVIVRMTIEEVVRYDALPAPGTAGAPAIADPAVSLALDLLCCLPALLVLARRVFDRGCSLRMACSCVPMLLLAAWTLASVAWSGDKFVALVNAADWAAALVLLWSTVQLVRDWLAFRIVSAVGFGLLLVLLVQGYYYRFVDLPDLQRSWEADKAALLREHGVRTGTTEAEQLGKNVLGGEPTGFNVSRNTYAAVLVLLMLCAAGIMLQRIHDKDHWAWSAPIILAIVLGLFMLYRYVQSKTAFATPVLGLGLLALIYWRRRWISENARPLYWAGLLLFGSASSVVVVHGLVRGTLFHISLTFRWWYWVGAARVFVHHPWRGVGWGNFGQHYLAYRLPQAAEEPRDPHNFLVRAFVELGIVGGLLMIAWMLRLWWELTVWPVAAPSENKSAQGADVPRGPKGPPAIPNLVAIAMYAIFLNALISIDWSMGSAWAFLEGFKRLLFFMALAIGLGVVAIASFDRQELDDRPAWWMLAGSLVALGLFLIHNLIDFSLFETGPMFLFALLAGAALGMRTESGGAPTARGRIAAGAGLAAGSIAAVAAIVLVLAPIAQAEALARRADEMVLHSKPPGAPPSVLPDARQLDRAADQLTEAFSLVPINADYAFRAQQALLLAHGDPKRMRELLDAAIAADPYSIRYLAARATLESSIGDAVGADRDYRRILELDPDDLPLRLQYAQWLESRARQSEARRQYEKTLELNDKLAPDEIRRLSRSLVEQIRSRIAGS